MKKTETKKEKAEPKDMGKMMDDEGVKSFMDFLKKEIPKDFQDKAHDFHTEFVKYGIGELENFKLFLYGITIALVTGIITNYLVAITTQGMNVMNVLSWIIFGISALILMFYTYGVYKILKAKKTMLDLLKDPKTREFFDLSVANTMYYMTKDKSGSKGKVK